MPQKSLKDLALLSIFFLFFLQLISELVEQIYSLCLLNTSPDENLLGTLFFLGSVGIAFFKKRKGSEMGLKISGIVFVIARIIDPLVFKQLRIVISGIGVASFYLFFPLWLSLSRKSDFEKTGFTIGLSLPIATGLSILFKTLNSSLDLSMWGYYQAIGWGLGIIALLILVFYKLDDTNQKSPSDTSNDGEKSPRGKALLLVTGFFGVIVLIWFAFGSPDVISRWTEANYDIIVIGLILVITLYCVIIVTKPSIFTHLKPAVVLLWNILFAAALVATLFVHRIRFSDDPSVVLIAPTTMWYHHIPLGIMILLCPVIFLDALLLIKELCYINPSRKQLTGAFTLGGGLFPVLVMYIEIFSFVWGYIEPVSTPFRNQFWLGFFLPAIAVILALLGLKKKSYSLTYAIQSAKAKIPVLILVGIIGVSTVIGSILIGANPETQDEPVTSLTIMTYNIQQGVNATGEKNYDGQLEFIKMVDPDILGLVETDTARISGGNSDPVRYFEEKLGKYYSYYGPKTVKNTYGVALLSKFPIVNTTVFYTYSQKDEIGTLQAELSINGEIYTVFVNHPANKYIVKNAQVSAVMERVNATIVAGGRVISLGDFNFRQFDEPLEDMDHYKNTTSNLVDTWLNMHPTFFADHPDGYDPAGSTPMMNMSRRIDHIFVSANLAPGIFEAVYIDEPASQTDHPAYWTKINI